MNHVDELGQLRFDFGNIDFHENPKKLTQIRRHLPGSLRLPKLVNMVNLEYSVLGSNELRELFYKRVSCPCQKRSVKTQTGK
jgi:2-methylisocitrate lyase-like PEP mutase family enzyme